MFPEHYSTATERLRWSICTRGISSIFGMMLLSPALTEQFGRPSRRAMIESTSELREPFDHEPIGQAPATSGERPRAGR
jgi:hypothetical protein